MRITLKIHRSGRIYPLLSLLVLMLGWELLCTVLKIPAYLLPKPSNVLQRVVMEWRDFLSHSLVTSWEIVLSFLLSALVGIPLAILITGSKLLRDCIYPLLISSQAIPKVAIAPIFLVWFGFGMMPKVLVGVLVAFFPIVINSIVGLESVDRNMKNLARSMGASGLQTFLKIRFPHALPNIFGGFKISIALAVVGAIVGEFIGSDKGLGYLLVVAGGDMDAEMVFASIVVLSVLGMLFFMLIGLIEKLVVPWKTSSGKEEVLQEATL